MPTSTASALPARLSLVPPFPPIATRLLSLLGQEAVDIKELADLISSDPMFTGRVLQYANSAEFGLLSPIRNVRQGLTTLGLERTRRITVAAAAGVYYRVALRTTELRRCWQHTIATAALAEDIARRCHAFAESAYAAGIMHDIGRLGLLAAYPAEYEKTMREAAARCVDLLDYEREIFGVDHAEAGRLLSARWNLPEEFMVVAGRHHDACEGTDLNLLRIVHVACGLADFFGYDVTHPLVPRTFDEIIAELPPPVAARLANSENQLIAAIHKSVSAFDSAEETEAPQQAWTKAHNDLLQESPEGWEGPAPSAGDDASSGPPSLLRRLLQWLGIGH